MRKQAPGKFYDIFEAAEGENTGRVAQEVDSAFLVCPMDKICYSKSARKDE